METNNTAATETQDISNFKPIGKFVLVRKCRRGDEGLIVTPDQYKDDTNFVEVIAIGVKCKIFTPEAIGKSVQCPDFSDGMHCINPLNGADYWVVREDVLDPVLFE